MGQAKPMALHLPSEIVQASPVVSQQLMSNKCTFGFQRCFCAAPAAGSFSHELCHSFCGEHEADVEMLLCLGVVVGSILELSSAMIKYLGNAVPDCSSPAPQNQFTNHKTSVGLLLGW